MKKVSAAVVTAALMGGLVVLPATAASASHPINAITYGKVYSYSCSVWSNQPGYCWVKLKQSDGTIQKTEVQKVATVTRCVNWGVAEGSAISGTGVLPRLKEMQMELAIEWNYPTAKYVGRVVCRDARGPQ